MLLLRGWSGRGWRAGRRPRPELPDALSDALDVGTRIVPRRLPSTPDQVSQARRIVGSVLGVRHACVDDARLLTSEIVTNAIRHANGIELLLKLEVDPDRVRIEVRDQGGTDLIPTIGQPQPDEPGGRGMQLVKQLSQRCGYTCDQRGTSVWFELTAPAG